MPNHLAYFVFLTMLHSYWFDKADVLSNAARGLWQFGELNRDEHLEKKFLLFFRL